MQHPSPVPCRAARETTVGFSTVPIPAEPFLLRDGHLW